MKKSKVFLGITTCFLAVAAVAATKANHRTLTHYYVTSGSSSCVLVNVAPISGCTLNKVTTCKTTAGVKTMFHNVTARGTKCLTKLTKPL